MMLGVLRFWAGVILLLLLAAPRLPFESFWAFWAVTNLPSWLRVGLIFMAGLTLIPQVNQHVQRILAWVWHRLPGRAYPQRWAIGVALAALPLFWLARLRHLRWGDAAVLVDVLSRPDDPVIYNWQAPFTVFLHQRLWQFVLQPAFGWGVDQTYALVSVLAGAAFVWFVWQVGWLLGADALTRGVIIALVLACGNVQLFFGYVENYTLITVGMVVFLYFGLRYLRGELPFWPVALALAFCNAFHPSTITLWPAALYLAWQQWRRQQTLLATSFALVLPPLLVGSSVLTLMEWGDHGLSAFLGVDRPGGGDYVWFVPLFETTTAFQHYTMFSAAHLIDWLNLQLLLSLFGLLILLVLLVGHWGRRDNTLRLTPLEQAQVWFLGLAAGSYLLLTWVWNADYGIRKDWDLFSPPAIIYTLLAAWLLTRTLSRLRLQEAAMLLLSVSSLHTLAWVFSNALTVPPL